MATNKFHFFHFPTDVFQTFLGQSADELNAGYGHQIFSDGAEVQNVLQARVRQLKRSNNLFER